MEYGPIRGIKDDVVLSPSLPRAAIRFHSDFIYLGDLQFIAQETFHVEDFILLSPNGLGHMTSMLLIHFEGFLENKPGVYENPELPIVTLDDQPYSYDISFINIQNYLAASPTSSLAHAADYVRQRAYTLAGDLTYQRFSRMVTPDNRNRFIIAYLEANDGPIVTPETLEHNPAIAQALQETALAHFTIMH